jgi:hypothetical protein
VPVAPLSASAQIGIDDMLEPEIYGRHDAPRHDNKRRSAHYSRRGSRHLYRLSKLSKLQNSLGVDLPEQLERAQDCLP